MRLVASVSCHVFALSACFGMPMSESASRSSSIGPAGEIESFLSEIAWRSPERAAGDVFIEQMVRRSVMEALSPEHREMIEQRLDYIDRNGKVPADLCFAPGTASNIVEAFAMTSGNATRYQLTARWSSTATDGGGLGQGRPTTLTYSFPPDGTTIPNIGIGFPTGTNDLNAWLNGIYGSPAVWQPLFAEVFDRWSTLSGLSYVLEPNDDGADLHNNAGVLGTRGDLRIAAMFLDGNSNVLAYNNFPNDGDMVFDSGDNFYNDTSGNSLRFRNVTFHEHGHGMGLLHVCPVNGSKLMEPFINTGFDGPQHDDIRAAQRHYGDDFEPDNSVAEANPLGVLSTVNPILFGSVPGPFVSDGSLVSIDANNEQDYYSFEITGSGQITVSVTPVGLNYDSSPQACGGAVASCCDGDFIDSDAFADLGVEVIDSNGTTVLGSATSAPPGVQEVLSNVALGSPGTYYVRIFEVGSLTEAQLYSLQITVDAIPVQIAAILPPTELLPGVETTFSVSAQTGTENIVPDSEQLFYSINGAPYLSAPLTGGLAGAYVATLPAGNCGDVYQYYVSVAGSGGSTATDPPNGPTDPFVATVGTAQVAVADDFEADLGWSVTSTASDGQWERGIPAGGGTRGDPPADFDGSGSCFVTDNAAGNSDVDGGSTTLTSPVFDISNVQDPIITYARWFDNTFGNAPEADVMTVEVSDNAGGSWTTLEVVGPTTSSPNPEVAGGWFQKAFRITDFVAATTEFQIRFIADDSADGSVVEAGVDAIEIAGLDCVPPTVGSIDLRVVLANGTGANANDTGPATLTNPNAGVDMYVQARIQEDANATGLTAFDGLFTDDQSGTFGRGVLTFEEALGFAGAGDDPLGREGMFPSYRATIQNDNDNFANGLLSGGVYSILPLNLSEIGNGEGINDEWANIYKLNWTTTDITPRTVRLDIAGTQGGYQSSNGLEQPVDVRDTFIEVIVDVEATGCPCDVDANVVVDIADLLAFLADWFPESDGSGTLNADFDSSGVVDISDLLGFLACWFEASSGGPCN